MNRRTFVAGAGAAIPAAQGGSAQMDLYRELIEASQQNKRGLTFYIAGQTIAGYVTKVIGDNAVEIRGAAYAKAVVRLDRIDALMLA